jgi:TetR/AcrR family transcriptional repressor of nem operon
MLELLADDPGAWAMTRLTRELAADPAVAEDVCAPLLDWVALVADIVRRGQAAGELRGGLDPDDTAAVLVAAFDGLKALTDVLDPGDAAAAVFVRRAGTLLLLVEHALLPDPR